MSPAFPEVVNICLLIGSCKWFSYFALFAQANFAFPVKVFLSPLMSFLTFTLLILFSTPPGERELCGTQLPAGLKLNVYAERYPTRVQTFPFYISEDKWVSTKLQFSKKIRFMKSIC